MDKDDMKNQAQGGAGDAKGKKDDKGQAQKGKGKEDGKKQFDAKQVEEALKNLNSSDPQKQQDAKDTLDKTVGPEARKEAEKLAQDLQSKDEGTRKAAEQKLENLKQQAQKQAGKEKGGSGKELSKEELKQLQDKLQDLDSQDETKRQAAEKEFDEKLGKDGRQRVQEELKKQKKATNNQLGKKEEKELQNKVEDESRQNSEGKTEGKTEGKDDGKKLTEEEFKELMEKGPDLTSPDDAKRQAAEKLFDEKIGKELRQKIQEEMKKEPPKDPKDPKQVDKARQKVDDFLRANNFSATSPPPLPPEAADPRNKAKTAELQLEEFEKHRGDRNLLERLKWTDEQYEEFLKDAAKRVEQLQKEAVAYDEELRRNPPPGAPVLRTDGGEKVEARGSSTQGSSSGATFAPAGFDEAKKRFQDAAKKLLPKQ
jgi:hypothetical protein